MAAVSGLEPACYTYHPPGRMTRADRAGAGRCHYSYDSTFNLTATGFADNRHACHTHHEAGRLTVLDRRDAGGSLAFTPYGRGRMPKKDVTPPRSGLEDKTLMDQIAIAVPSLNVRLLRNVFRGANASASFR